MRVYKRFKDWWDDNFRLLELLLSGVVAVAFGVWIFAGDGWQVVAPYLSGKRAEIYGTLAGILGSLLGFVIAAVAIVIGETTRLDFIRKAGHLGALFDVFRQTLTALGLGTVVVVAALVIDGARVQYRFVPVIVLFFVVLSILKVKRAIWILSAVMRSAAR